MDGNYDPYSWHCLSPQKVSSFGTVTVTEVCHVVFCSSKFTTVNESEIPCQTEILGRCLLGRIIHLLCTASTINHR